jgi:predicted outer membrane protein
MARFHQLVGLVGMAFVGVAACNMGGGGDEKGMPGGGKGSTPGAPEANACLGPTWFGAIEESKRAPLIDLVCADARAGTVPTARLGDDAGPSCKGAFAVKSDDELTAVVEAVDNGLSRQGSLGETNATSPKVKEMASVIRAAHARDTEMDNRMLARRNARPAEDATSRAIAKGFEDNDKTLQGLQGAAFDRELVDRLIIQHARAIELYEALAPEAQGKDLRSAVENERNAAMGHLKLACETRADLPPAATRRPHPSLTRPSVTTVAPAKPATLAAPPASTPSAPPASTQAAPPAASSPPPVVTAEPNPAPSAPAPAETAPAVPASMEPVEQAPAAPVTPEQAPAAPVTPEQAPAAPVAPPDPCAPCP